MPICRLPALRAGVCLKRLISECKRARCYDKLKFCVKYGIIEGKKF